VNDSEAREIILQNYYDKRTEDFVPINEKTFGTQFPITEIYRISEQLDGLGFIRFKSQSGDDKIVSGWGKVTVFGIDYIEKRERPTISSISSELNGGIQHRVLDLAAGRGPIESAANLKDLFVDEVRIEELQRINSHLFDLSKLIQLCYELNSCYKNDCYLAVTMLARTVLNHVPPIFGYKTFDEVANNYQGGSFKKSMSHLQNSLRNIADAYLHLPIREKETLPNKTQVNFANDLDVLLAEIVRVLK